MGIAYSRFRGKALLVLLLMVLLHSHEYHTLISPGPQNYLMHLVLEVTSAATSVIMMLCHVDLRQDCSVWSIRGCSNDLAQPYEPAKPPESRGGRIFSKAYHDAAQSDDGALPARRIRKDADGSITQNPL